MPFDVPLPKKLKVEGWKVEIREKERIEPPHVTVMHKADEWRLGLHDKRLLVPPGGRIKDIDPAVMQIIEEHRDELIEAWDEKYPENPVSGAEDEEDGNEDDARDRTEIRLPGIAERAVQRAAAAARLHLP
jgi:hypothetical protein